MKNSQFFGSPLKKTSAFGSLSFYRNALSIALPVMGQLLIQTFVTLIDNFMVAQLGDIKMSGVNVANQLVFVLLTALYALAAAGGMFMAQYSGAKDKDGMQQVFRFKILTMGFIALASMIISFLIPAKMLATMMISNTNAGEITQVGTPYMILIAFTFVPSAISIAISSSLREIGNVKPPLYISTIASIVNAIGNYILIYGNFGAPRLEIVGAAYATIFARILEMLCFIIYARKTQMPFYVKLTKMLKVKLTLFGRIFAKSNWLFIAELSWVITETIITAIYNQRGGTEVVAGMAAGWAISELFFLTYTGVGTAVAVIVGGTLGKNQIAEAREQARWLRSGAVLIGIFNAIFQFLCVFIFIPLFFGELSKDAQIIARNLLWAVALYMPVWTYQHSQYATLRSGGDAFTTAWIDTSVNVLFFLPVVFILKEFTPFGPVLMYFLVKLGSLIKPMLAFIIIKKEKWLINLTTLKK